MRPEFTFYRIQHDMTWYDFTPLSAKRVIQEQGNFCYILVPYPTFHQPHNPFGSTQSYNFLRVQGLTDVGHI